LEKKQHEVRYPGYKYRPKKTRKRTKRRAPAAVKEKKQKVEELAEVDGFPSEYGTKTESKTGEEGIILDGIFSRLPTR
jgi:hypothetical protein